MARCGAVLGKRGWRHLCTTESLMSRNLAISHRLLIGDHYAKAPSPRGYCTTIARSELQRFRMQAYPQTTRMK